MNNFERKIELFEKTPGDLGTIFETQVTFKIIDVSKSPPIWKTIGKLETQVVKTEDIYKKLKSLNKKYDVKKNVWLFHAYGQREMAFDWLSANKKKL